MLLAALYALRSLAVEHTNCNVLLRINNVTALSCISVKYNELNKIVRDIWHWCKSKNIFVFASYINTSNNKQADSLSRLKFVNTEFELNSWAV